MPKLVNLAVERAPISDEEVESAIHSAFHPGSHPFALGGIVHVAGTHCFYLVKTHAFMDGNKRMGALTAMLVLYKNGWDLQYPQGNENQKSTLGEIIKK